MTILNFDSALTEINGDVLKNKKDESWLMKSAVIECVLAPNKDLSAEDSLRAFNLAQKVQVGGDIDFTPEEIVNIKNSVGKNAFPLVSGQILKYINSATVSKPNEDKPKK